jgi:hypothetical protein
MILFHSFVPIKSVLSSGLNNFILLFLKTAKMSRKIQWQQEAFKI